VIRLEHQLKIRRKMPSVTFRLRVSSELRERLEAEARRLKCTVNDLVRAILRHNLRIDDD